MAYSAEICRSNPACVLVLIDQSESMAGPFGGGAGTRAEEAARAVNRWVYNLALRCIRGQAVLDRFQVGVIGYGAGVDLALGGLLAGRTLVPISEVAHTPLRIEEADKLPVWVDPLHRGAAPLCAALKRAMTVLTEFLAEYPDSFPPLVVNIASGESTDGDPSVQAEKLRQLSTSDGNVLLFNVHVSARASGKVELPDSENTLADSHARRLFRMSSFLPPGLWDAARQAGFAVNPGTRGFASNADLAQVISFLEIGTSLHRSRGNDTSPSQGAAASPTPAPRRAASSVAPSPRPAEGNYAVALDRLYDVRCSLGDKLVTYTGVRLVGLSGGLPVRGGALFDRWLVLESPGGRKVYVKPEVVVAIEDRAGEAP
jgi:hypothetical protein